MNPKYVVVLYDQQHQEITRLRHTELKKDAEELLSNVDIPYAYAEIKTVYWKGGEA